MGRRHHRWLPSFGNVSCEYLLFLMRTYKLVRWKVVGIGSNRGIYLDVDNTRAMLDPEADEVDEPKDTGAHDDRC